jgi:tetratricopeptide (TPR) repeat protein
MQPDEIQQKLKDAIQAIRSGERERGRDLLLHVVEADDHVEPAWLWLSVAVDDPNDKLIALENALTLNPGNAQARAELRKLRKQLGVAEDTPIPESVRAVAPPPARTPAPETTPAPIPESAPASPTPIPGTAVDLDDDPLQCAYCGRLTTATDNACPHCGRSLLTWGKWRGGIYLYLVLLLCGLNLQASFLQLAGPALAIGLSQGMDPSLVEPLADFGITAYMGDILGHYHGLEIVAVVAALLRTALWLGLTFMFYNDMESAFVIAAGVGLADAAWTWVSVRWLGLPGPVGAWVNWGLAGLIVLISVPAVISRSQARMRLRVELDREALSAPEAYKRGLKYQRQGKWALAALHWRKAVVMMPDEPLFFKALGLAQMELGRYAKALATLEEGASRAPRDAEFKTLLETARTKVSTDKAADKRMRRS